MSTVKNVIDVSHFNGTIDWTKVKGTVDAVIIRAGYRGYGSAGTLQMDPMFKSHIAGAINAGIPVGIYWCSQAISDAEALAEANYLNNLLQGYNITYPVYLDSETMGPNACGRADKLTKAKRTVYGLTFCKAMRGYGYMAGLYCSESWYTANIDGAAFARAGFEIWIAKYSSTAPSMACDAWQYTSTGKVAGISGNVDLSEFYVDYALCDDYTAVQARFGLADNTMAYLQSYKYSADLLHKLAETDLPIQETDYRARVQARFRFSDGTMDYLEAWNWGQDLLRKLATAE